MKRRSPLPIHQAAAASISTGEHCPATGWWIPEGTTEPWRHLSEGSVMPALNGQPTAWIRAVADKVPEQLAAEVPKRSLSPA